jgi:hypothetical protein
MSPITGLSESRRLPRLGKVRLGIKAKNAKGTEYPKAVDYFVCPPEVQAIYGEKPKSLDIIFPVDLWPEQWYKAYSASRGLICKGDGKQAMALIDPATGKFATATSPTVQLTEVACDPEACPLYEKKQCHRIMNLQFIIPQVKALGVWQLDTGSVNSIININSSLDLIKGITGRVSMIPMKLVVEPQEAQVEGKKKTIHVLKLVVERSFNELVELPNLPRATVLLPSSDTEAPDDLYPEGVIASDPEEPPAQVAARPGPARRKRSTALLSAPKQEEEPAQPEVQEIPAEQPPAEKPPAKTRRREPESLTTEQHTIINQLYGVDSSKFAIQKLIKKYGEKDPSWNVKNSGGFSEYQAAVILHVLDGGAAEDIA